MRSIDRLVPPPTSLARLTATPAASAARQPNRPLPRNRFDDGLCAICAPAAASARAVGVVEPDAVREHAARVEQAGARVDVEVAARLGEQLAHPAHLGAVLGDVGLHVEARVGARSSAPGHRQLLAACWSARSAPSPHRRAGRGRASARSASSHVALGLCDVVAQVGGRVAVHQHLAGDDAHAARLRRGEQRVDRRRVHGREDDRRGRAVREQRVEEVRRGRPRRAPASAWRALGREGVASSASRAARCRSSR